MTLPLASFPRLWVIWQSALGLPGVAAALLTSTLLSQSHLGLWGIFSVVATWLVLCVAALAIHVGSLPVAVGTLWVLGVVLLGQTRNLAERMHCVRGLCTVSSPKT